MTWFSSPHDFFDDADTAIAEWLVHASHTGDMGTLSTLLNNKFSTGGTETVRILTLPFDRMGQVFKCPLMHVYTHKFESDEDAAVTRMIVPTTTLTVFSSGSVGTDTVDAANAADMAIAMREATGLLSAAYSMLQRTHHAGAINDWDSVYFNSAESPEIELDSDEFDPYAESELGIVVRASAKIRWSHVEAI